MPQRLPGKRALTPLTMGGFLPPVSAFKPHSADIMRTVRGGPPGFENTNVWTSTNQTILLTGVWPEGHRQKVGGAVQDSYTHIALVDPAVEIRDIYKGNNQPQADINFDTFAIPAGQNADPNWVSANGNIWGVQFSFLYFFQGLGRRRVVLLDRFTGRVWPGIM